MYKIGFEDFPKRSNFNCFSTACAHDDDGATSMVSLPTLNIHYEAFSSEAYTRSRGALKRASSSHSILLV